MTKKEVAKKFRELAPETMRAWEYVHKALLEVDGTHNRLFQPGCAVKTPSFLIYDALNKMADQLDSEDQ